MGIYWNLFLIHFEIFFGTVLQEFSACPTQHDPEICATIIPVIVWWYNTGSMINLVNRKNTVWNLPIWSFSLALCMDWQPLVRLWVVPLFEARVPRQASRNVTVKLCNSNWACSDQALEHPSIYLNEDLYNYLLQDVFHVGTGTMEKFLHPAAIYLQMIWTKQN